MNWTNFLAQRGKTLLLPISLFLVSTITLCAQQNSLAIENNLLEEELQGQTHTKTTCATPPMTEAQIRYTLDIVDKANADRNAGMTAIPIRIHIVTEDDGSGGITLGDINIGMSYLNYFYQEASIEYYICGVNYISSSAWYTFDQTEEAALTAAHSVDDAVNIFFVNSINGGSYCGYAYYPGNGDYSINVLMDNGCTAGNDNGTLVHEMGHFFNLAHTHNYTTNGNADANAEHVPRSGANSNCGTAGDLLCDTEADPNGSNDSNCNFVNDGNSQQDIYGNVYTPDLDNIMSYYSDYCGGIFTPEQYTRIANGLVTRLAHTAYDLDGCQPQVVPDASGLAAVLNNSYGVDLTWVDNASNETGYLIERSSDGGTTWFAVSGGGVGPDVTTFTDNTIIANTTYDYRIKASNDDSNDYSNTANIAVGLVYCVMSNNSSSCTTGGVGVGIDNFTFSFGGSNLISNLNNGCNGGLSVYSSTFSAPVNVSSTYDYSISLLSNGGSYYPCTHGIWVDFNQDGDFDDTGEEVIQNTTAGGIVLTGSFTIPASALSGATTMRVRVRNNGTTSSPCDYYSWAEAEDYELDILGGLPVELISFTGKKQNDIVELQWATASEDNNDYFIIERSSNGQDFEFLNEVSGVGSSEEINRYDLMDRQPLNGINYYRLVQVDFDGTKHVEDKMVAVEFIKGATVTIVPNPVSSEIVNIEFLTEQSGDCQLIIYDLNGRVVYQVVETADKGSNQFSLQIPDLPNGVYVIRAGQQGDIQTQRFIKAM